MVNIIQGTDSSEILSGLAVDDSISALDGDDTISALAGNDTLQGNAGNDSISGGEGLDILRGGMGNDLLFGDQDNDTLLGNIGNDTLDGGSGNDSLEGREDDDSLDGATGDDTLQGNAGSDTISGSDGNDIIRGGKDNDSLLGGSGNDLLFGNLGNDTIAGNGGNDTVNGGMGNDVLVDSNGDDHFIGAEGEDTVVFTGDFEDYITIVDGSNVTITDTVGGDGTNILTDVEFVQFANSTITFIEDPVIAGTTLDDSLVGTADIDTLQGLEGNDTIEGLASGDSLQGNQGNDSIQANEGDDSARGGQDHDTISGDAGNDTLFGDKGNDMVTGGTGNDLIQGNAGNDSLAGNDGDDTIRGGKDSDTLDGGAGNDTLFGNLGNDTITGGEGTDTAAYAGNFEQYTIDVDAVAKTITVTDTVGSEGEDFLTGVEFLQFLNSTVSIDNNEAPVLSGVIASTTFLENTVNAAATVIDSDVTVTDVDSTNFSGGNVTVTYSSTGLTEDNLSVIDGGSITVVGTSVRFMGTEIGIITTAGTSGSDLVVTLNDNATIARVEAMIEQIAYSNTSDTPTGSRTIEITINDGDSVGSQGVSDSVSTIINVTAEDEPLSFTLTAGSDNFSGGGVGDSFTTLDANFAGSDSLAGNAGQDTLTFTDTANITIATLANKTSIDIIAFQASGNSAVFNDSFVDSTDNDQVELANSTHTITSLDTSGVSTLRDVVIGGTGEVTLADAANRVLSKDGTNSHINGGTGADTIEGGSGADSFSGGEGSDSIDGGAGNDSIYGDNTGFTVTSVSGLLLWLDANDTSTITLDGVTGDVETWSDKSGLGHHAVQTIDANQPTRSGDVITFDTNDHILGPGLGLTGADAYTAFIVFTRPDGGSSKRILQFGDDNGTVGQLVALDVAENVSGHRYNNGNRVITDDFSDTTPIISSWSNSDGGTYGSAQIFLDNVEATYVAPTNGGFSTSLVDDEYLLGAGRNSSGTLTNFSSASIREVLMFDSDLSSADRLIVHRYLAAKHDITVSGISFDPDTLTGGAGQDSFIYTDEGDSRVGSGNRDIITDFSQSDGDIIDFSAFSDSFSFIGGAAFSGTGKEVRFTQPGGGITVVEADANADGSADFEIELTGLITLTGSDFIL